MRPLVALEFPASSAPCIKAVAASRKNLSGLRKTLPGNEESKSNWERNSGRENELGQSDKPFNKA